ncbi:acVLRF1 family peptidyl-tRNA hydrolase [Actinocatenispora rupis]|uniref:Actinobacteria/chloroflexi VLRF1 release factor domain-containing protein n=1 Tax=Actinocatenispora rupis TaxID=519421 RepID=A0A8J3N7T9_9ACTN|nr:acVLRF1 family peptidyl-tRNA hydrolase [Actinocatenispora rupis]GID09426.1 hypothetical protein Aru02nite_03150 [Actinocatenispora rupis]
MAGTRPAAGGGRWVSVPPERIARWLAGFGERHGATTAERTAGGLLVAAADGATADCHLPFGWPAANHGTEPADALAAAAAYRWRVGVLLIRRGAHAVGVADGADLAASKVDTRYVQGRTAAGGWSQQRFARRRDKQTRESTDSAADHAARVLLPAVATLTGLVTGGDRAMTAAVLDDRRLAPLRELPRVELPDVPEPRHATLVEAARRYREVRILVREP